MTDNPSGSRDVQRHCTGRDMASMRAFHASHVMNLRRITRWQHEHVLEAVQQRLDENPQAMRQRRRDG